MTKIWIVLCFTQLLYMIKFSTEDHLKCLNNPSEKRSIQIFFNRKQNETGNWVHTLKAQAVINNIDEQINLNLNHTTLECDGKRIVIIQGTYDPYEEIPVKRLTFHERCGKSVEILNEGKTVQRKPSNEYYTAAFTSRPLNDDEIFEVILEEDEKKGGWAAQIGVITESPENIKIISDFSDSADAVVYVGTRIFYKGKLQISAYGKPTSNWKVGERLGVMKNKLGKLFFFYNGEPLGEAASGLPPIVYGVFELFGSAKRASIVGS